MDHQTNNGSGERLWRDGENSTQATEAGGERRDEKRVRNDEPKIKPKIRCFETNPQTRISGKKKYGPSYVLRNTYYIDTYDIYDNRYESAEQPIAAGKDA